MLPRIAIHWFLVLAWFGCFPAPPATGADRPLFVVTVEPLGMILRELVAGRAEVTVLLPPGGSPHTYEPRPSDAVTVGKSVSLFWVSPLLDGWAVKLSSDRKVQVLDLLPADERLFAETHVHGDREKFPESRVVDPHFWTDPLEVRAMLPRLTEELARLDPEGRAVYARNADAFSKQLQLLHEELQRTLAPVRGQAVILFHPSFLYLLRRYGLVCAGAVEPSPGREPTAREMQDLIRRVKLSGVRAIFSEPQLPVQPARVMAESAHVKLSMLDPTGGVEGRRTYGELLRYNAAALAEALSEPGTEAQRLKGTKPFQN
jgi:ABC-type Zn uptake system ZnuABC Zn-binding protein ZnuA